jgi:hypothetical protein
VVCELYRRLDESDALSLVADRLLCKPWTSEWSETKKFLKNELNWGFYSQQCYQILSLHMSVILSVFPQGFETEWVKVILQ